MQKFIPTVRFCLLAGMWFFVHTTFLAGQSSVAPGYRLQIRQLTPEEGLKGYVIKSVCQDDRGMMWIVTNEMVQRFDGQELTYYPGLLDRWKIGRVVKLLQGPEKQIWMISGTVKEWPRGRNGIEVNWIKILTGNVDEPAIGVDLSRRGAPFVQEDIHQIDEAEGGGLHFFLKNGQVYHHSGDAFERVYENPYGRPVSHYKPATSGHYWVGENNYLSLVDEQGNISETDTFPCPVFFLYTNEAGNAFISGGVAPFPRGETGENPEDGFPRLFYKEVGKKPVTRLPEFEWDLDDFYLARPWGKDRLILLKDKLGELWVMEKGKGQVLQIDWGIWWQPKMDRRGRLWVPFNKGLKMVTLRKGEFQTLLEDQGVSTRGISPWRDSLLWVNSYRGIYLLDKRGVVITHNPQDFGNLGLVQKDSLMITGTHNNQIRYYERAEAVGKLEWVGEKMEEKQMCLPLVDKKGRIWLGGVGGLWMKETADAEWEEIWDNTEEWELRWLSEEPEGILFAHTEGLWCMDLETRTASSFSKALEGVDIIHVYRASADSFWISTAADGIVYWNRRKDKLTFVEESVGLENNRVYAIYPDKKGCLWMPTDKGMYRYHPPSKVFQVFGESDGISHPEFNYFSHYQDVKGRLYFGGVDGITTFNPDDFTIPSPGNAASPLCVSGVQHFSLKNGFKDFTDEFQSRGQLKIGPRGGMYSLKLSLPDDMSGDYPPRFYYRLSSSEEWRMLEGRSMNLRNVPYGNYSVQVKAVGFDGKVYQQELEVPLLVIRPFHQTIWFWLSLSLLFLTMISLLVRYQKRKHLRQQEKLEAEVRKRTLELERINNTKDRLFSVIGHELRTPIVNMQLLGKNLEYLLQQGKKEELRNIFSGMEQQSVYLRGMLDNLLLWGQNQTGRLPFRPQRVEVEKEIRDCGQTYAPVAQEKGISISWQKLPPDAVLMDPHILCICFQNLLSNALKFTPPGGRIDIFAEVKEGYYLLRVKDSGRGLGAQEWNRLFSDVPHSRNGTEGEKGAGIGLTIVRDMLRRYRGEVMLENNPDQGVTATLRLRLHEEAIRKEHELGKPESADFSFIK